MQCCFCGKPVNSIEEAIELEWYPDFWHLEVQYQGPICPDCQREHLKTDEEGEYILKTGHSLPPFAVPVQGLGVAVEPAPLEASPGIRPKFALGQIVATPAALKALEESGQIARFLLESTCSGGLGRG